MHRESPEPVTPAGTEIVSPQRREERRCATAGSATAACSSAPGRRHVRRHQVRGLSAGTRSAACPPAPGPRPVRRHQVRGLSAGTWSAACSSAPRPRAVRRLRVVKTDCRSAIGQHLKSSGISWTGTGAAARASSTWEAICKRPRSQIGAAWASRTLEMILITYRN
jgi:hypothetical protein